MFLTDYFFQDLLFIITSYRPDISFQTFLLDQSYMTLTASEVYKIIQVNIYKDLVLHSSYSLEKQRLGNYHMKNGKSWQGLLISSEETVLS